MGTFNAKHFNSEVFLKYLETVPRERLVRLLNSGVLVRDRSFGVALPEQVGGNYIIKPFKARLSGNPVNYDGATDITASTMGTYKQGIVAIGRAKGFNEKDFTESITGHDFLSDVAVQLVEYWQNVNEGLILSILKGIFGSAIAANVYDEAGVVNVNTLNNAMQAVAGDLKDHFALVFMHSAVATKLENLQLLEYLKYNDGNGIQRDLNLATWNGRLVFVTDRVPTTAVAAVYTLTSDEDIVAGKTYYTRSGSGTSESPYVYTAVASPVKANIATYYEKTADAYTEYVTYVLGRGAFGYDELPVKVPVEMARDAFDDGGIDTLISRERLVLAPYGITFKAAGMSAASPTDAELETSSAWELAKDASNNAISTKVLPFLAIKTRSN